jgi:hypothetical protein
LQCDQRLLDKQPKCSKITRYWAPLGTFLRANMFYCYWRSDEKVQTLAALRKVWDIFSSISEISPSLVTLKGSNFFQ